MVKHYHGDDEDLRALMGAVTRACDTVTVEDPGSEDPLVAAQEEHWPVVSMKNDWVEVFGPPGA
jgi:hypothetical protein